jgi:N-acetylglucosaminyldiphosphoundecaprenol N-acetyl-beta-D-mannosaminyltransferase
MNSDPQKFVLMGIPFHDVTFAETVAWARERIRWRVPAYMATANIDFVMQAWSDPELQRILLEASLVIADGMPIVWMSKLFGPPLRERVTGSDLVPLLAGMCRDEGFSIFYLGGAPGVAEKAAAELTRRFPGLKTAGCYSPPLADIVNMDHAAILARLEASKPDLLLVAFGAPKQEKWANMHVRQWKVPLAVGVGGKLDFLGGAQTRAPKFVQQIGFEWLWRMFTNPKRLFRRYAKNLVFLARVSARLLWLRARFPKLGKKTVPIFRGLENISDLALAVRWPGLLDAGAAQTWTQKLDAEAGARSVVLNMTGVRWLTSLELGALLTLSRLRRARDARLLLAGLGGHARRLVDLCRLDRYLELADAPDQLEHTIRTLHAALADGKISRDQPGRLVFVLPRELTAANLPAWRAKWDAAWQDASREVQAVVIDGAATRFIDSAALGFLVGIRKAVTTQGLTWQCGGFGSAVSQIIKIARVEKLLLAE